MPSRPIAVRICIELHLQMVREYPSFIKWWNPDGLRRDELIDVTPITHDSTAIEAIKHRCQQLYLKHPPRIDPKPWAMRPQEIKYWGQMHVVCEIRVAN